MTSRLFTSLSKISEALKSIEKVVIPPPSLLAIPSVPEVKTRLIPVEPLSGTAQEPLPFRKVVAVPPEGT